MAIIAAHLNAGVTDSGGDSVAIGRCSNLPLPPPPYPLTHFFPSLKSLVVFVDFKRHVYLLTLLGANRGKFIIQLTKPANGQTDRLSVMDLYILVYIGSCYQMSCPETLQECRCLV